MAGKVYYTQPTIEDFSYLTDDTEKQKKLEQAQAEYSATGSYTLQTPTTQTTVVTPDSVTDTDSSSTEDYTPTTEELTQTVLDQQAEETTKSAEELGMEKGTYYTGMEEYVQDQLASQATQVSLTEEGLGVADYADAIALREATQQAESYTEAVKADKAPQREGVISSTAETISADYAARMANKIRAYESQVNYARSQRQNALANLKLAQKENNTALIQRYQAEYNAAYLEAQQAETDWMNAYSTFSDTQLAQQQERRYSLESFQGLVESGIQLSTTAIQGYADQLGIDFYTAYQYYQGAEALRADKTIDVQTKATKLNQLNLDLQDAITGGALKAQNKLDYYLEQIGSGKYDAAGIQTLAALLEIPDSNNPVYQAELKLSQAEAKIKEDISNGVISNPMEYLEYLSALGEYNNMLGVTDVYMPSSPGEYTMAISSNGVRVGVTDGQSLDAEGTERREDYCGAFVNDVLGTSFGNEYTQKVGMINSYTPVAGAAFVQATSDQYGHVGIIESVDLVNGVMNVVEANWQKGADGKGIISRRTMKISDATGFVVPTASTKVANGSAGAGTFNAETVTYSDITQYNEFFASGGKTYPYWADTAAKKADFEAKADSFKEYYTSPDTDLTTVLSYSTGNKSLTDTAVQSLQKNILTIDQLNELEDSFDSLKESDFGPIMGILSGANPYNEKAQLIKAELQSIVPNLARGVYGEVGVLTDTDIANYIKTIPNLTSTKDLRDALLDMTRKTIGRGLETKLRTYSGTYDVSGYQFIISEYGLGSSDAVDTLESDKATYQTSLITQEQDSTWDSL